MLIPTLCDWFSSSASACDFHLIVSDQVLSGIRTLFSLDRKVPGSDSVPSENQPIGRKGTHKNSSLGKTEVSDTPLTSRRVERERL